MGKVYWRDWIYDARAAIPGFALPVGSSAFYPAIYPRQMASESESSVQVHPADIEKTAMASNRFALDMYRELAGRV